LKKDVVNEPRPLNPSLSKVTFISKWKSLTKEGNQPQQVGGEGKGFLWSRHIRLHVGSKLMHVLLEHIPLHE